MPSATPFPPPIPRGQMRRFPWAVTEASGPARSASPVRRPRQSLVTLVLSVALLAATALTAAPVALAYPLDPGPPVPVPRPASARPTPVRLAIVTGTNESPMAAPPSTNAGNRSQK